MAKKGNVRTWWVLSQVENGFFKSEYSGPDKKKARAVAAVVLKDSKASTVPVKVFAALISKLTPLEASDLESNLSKDAF